MKRRPIKDAGFREAVEAAGGYKPLARLLGIDHTAVLRWTRVPYERLIEVERVTGVPREILRPELFHKAK